MLTCPRAPVPPPPTCSSLSQPPVVLARVLVRLAALPLGPGADHPYEEHHSDKVEPYVPAGQQGAPNGSGGGSSSAGDSSAGPGLSAPEDSASAGGGQAGGGAVRGGEHRGGAVGAVAAMAPASLVDTDLFLELLVEEVAFAADRAHRAAVALFGPDANPPRRVLAPSRPGASQRASQGAAAADPLAWRVCWAATGAGIHTLLRRCVAVRGVGAAREGGDHAGRSGMLPKTLLAAVLRSGVCGWGAWPPVDPKRGNDPAAVEREEWASQLIDCFRETG